jgi:shikimate dehydrogenase
MRNFGLIGFPLEHSYSEKYFAEKFTRENITDCQFRLFALKSIDEFTELIKAEKFNGLSVTIPYKQTIIPFLNKLDEQATAIGAVNCVKFEYSKRGVPTLTGYNTDTWGFETLLKKFRIPVGIKALVLGTGGTSQAVTYVLRQFAINYLVVSRKPSTKKIINYNEVNHEIVQEHRLIINTTPVGMFPLVKKCPDIPFQFITPNHICIDLIYNPARTLFLSISEKQGARITNGLDMLYAQAERSWEIWNK